MFDIDNTVFLHQQAILKELLAENLTYLSLVLCVLKNCDDFPISHDPYSPPPLFFRIVTKLLCCKPEVTNKQWIWAVDAAHWYGTMVFREPSRLSPKHTLFYPTLWLQQGIVIYKMNNMFYSIGNWGWQSPKNTTVLWSLNCAVSPEQAENPLFSHWLNHGTELTGSNWCQALRNNVTVSCGLTPLKLLRLYKLGKQQHQTTGGSLRKRRVRWQCRNMLGITRQQQFHENSSLCISRRGSKQLHLGGS